MIALDRCYWSAGCPAVILRASSSLTTAVMCVQLQGSFINMQASHNAVLVCAIVLLGASVASAQAPSTGFLGQLQAGVGGANASAVSGTNLLFSFAAIQPDLSLHNSWAYRLHHMHSRPPLLNMRGHSHPAATALLMIWCSALTLVL